jgi:DNA-binding NarL/FixJ family response regulator
MLLAMSQPSSEPAKLQILVVDDHEVVLGGTIDLLKRQYPQAEILTAQTVESALHQLKAHMPDLVVLDLSLPERPGEPAQAESGVQLLKTLMQNYPTLNLTVQSTHVKALVRIKPEIDRHNGGFTVADKSLSSKEMLTRVDWALKGITHTKDIRPGRTLEVKPDWLTVLKLAFHEGLQDRAIANRMKVSERTVRHYWTKIQDVLDVYPEEDKQDGKNIRIQTEIRAREEGLID